MPDGIRLGGGQGFYGDTPRAVEGLLESGVDYLCLEALAELTLAILQKDRARDETLGYTRDLPRYLAASLPTVVDGRTKVVTNAGGINPTAAAHAAKETAKALGLSGFKVATVLGDDLMTRLDSLPGDTSSGLSNMETGEPFSALPGAPLFASAYLGAFPIAQALAEGADVGITGRVADAALFLGPLIHEHGWAKDDWDRLSAGILVGHLLECSGQVAGGNFPGEWWTIPEPWNLPYPIADVTADGTAVISKPATDTYKALLAYHAGWAGETRVAFSWPDAPEKAKATAAILAKRVEMAGIEVREWCFEYWGVNALGGATVPPLANGVEPPECVLRAAWRCDDERSARAVGRELVPLALSAPPAGLTGMGRGMAGASSELLGLWPTLVDKSLVDPSVTVTVEEI
jgi:hypothetical protein